MSKIWTILMLIAIVAAAVLAPDKFLPSMVEASNGAFNLTGKLTAVYAVWMGLIMILEQTGATKALSRLFKPLIRFLFGKEISPECGEFISMNFAANLLGAGGAATPMGIKAIESMDDKSGRATNAMIMLIVINSIGLQILPTTVIGMRAAAGSQNASGIILPTLAAMASSLIVGVSLVKLIGLIPKRKARREKK